MTKSSSALSVTGGATGTDSESQSRSLSPPVRVAAAATSSSTTTGSTHTIENHRGNDDGQQQQSVQKQQVDELNPQQQQQHQQQQLDFIVSSHAVKELFSLPYTATDKTVSVAVHNLDGTLVIDEDPELLRDDDAADPFHQSSQTKQNRLRRRRPRPRPRPRPSPQLPRQEEEDKIASVTEDNHQGEKANHPSTSTTTEENTTILALPDSENSEALTLVINSINNQSASSNQPQAALPVLPASSGGVSSSTDHTSSIPSDAQTSTALLTGLPRPHDYVNQYIPPTVAPREYLSWNFHDLNLLVGSNALIYRAPPPPPSAASQSQSSEASSSASSSASTSAAGQAVLTVRVEDAHEMQALMDRHVAALRMQQQHLLAAKPSYAQAVQKQRPTSTSTAAASSSSSPSSSSQATTPEASPVDDSSKKDAKEKDDDDEDDDDLSKVRLQTCIVPVPHAPLGGLVQASLLKQKQKSGQPQPDIAARDDAIDRNLLSTSSAAVSTVLDAYLDNIISNVPQLALCLREKGFIQSVKLLGTQDIPSRLLQPSTLDTSKPFDIVTSAAASGSSKNTTTSSRSSPSVPGVAPDPEEVFSPQIIEMNASTLLRFLQTNCTRDNSTYLLQREAGQTNIQLYDISAISQQKQRKWIWWLAMMSYRFANRLGHIAHSSSTMDSSTAAAGGNNMDSSTHQYGFEPSNNGGGGIAGGCSPALQRSFRNRQRGLLQNTLDLLEVLSDMDGMSHESLVAAVQEQLADTFLWIKDNDNAKQNVSHESGSTTATDAAASSQRDSTAAAASSQPPPATAACSSHQPYGGVTVDALNKAHDHLTHGIKYLWPILERNVQKRETMFEAKKKKRNKKKKQQSKRRHRHHASQSSQQETTTATPSPSESLLTVSEDTSSGSDDSGAENDQEDYKHDDDDAAEYDLEVEAIALQLFGLHQKLVNVSLRLAEIHLRNYSTSSAMQSMRTTARRIADSLYLVALLSSSEQTKDDPYNHHANAAEWTCRPQLQFVWLWEHCGHFARSFAADVLWRERGHAAADDILIVLQDAEAAFRNHKHLNALSSASLLGDDEPPLDRIFHMDPLLEKTSGSVNLQSLSGLVKTQVDGISDDELDKAMQAAQEVLAKQRLLPREERKVIIAACIAYNRAICAYEALRPSNDDNQSAAVVPTSDHGMFDPALLGLLQQRLGDASNEAGKILLNELRTLLTSLPTEQSGDKAASASSLASATNPLLSSAEFWFSEGLSAFEKCHDLRNLALLRCNLCQCYKLRANAIFAPTKSTTGDGPAHAEECLQEAANQLQAAHEAMGERDVDPACWDMVSTELAATFLVLGVRRRQSLIGSGNVPVFVQSLRLTPGKERSIVEPMERALTIYEEARNFQQAAAAHYQLALFYSKIWTCQRDANKTREKLSSAFSHYNAAHSFFANNVRGNETTFCLLCLDLSNLYSSVQGEEGLSKALLVCLDTHQIFSAEAITAKVLTTGRHDDWFQQMNTLASNVEERVLNSLRSLVKLQEDGSATSKTNYKDAYRAALRAKMAAASSSSSSSSSSIPEGASSYPTVQLLAVHDVLLAVQSSMNSSG